MKKALFYEKALLNYDVNCAIVTQDNCIITDSELHNRALNPR